MKIIIPHSIQISPAFAARPHHVRFLEIVFGDEDDRARAGCFSRRASNSADDVFVGLIADSVRRVETESVEMKFLNPISSVRNEKFADRSRIWPVEIDRVAPFVFLLTNQIIIGKNPEIIPVRPEVVIDDIENHTEA